MKTLLPGDIGGQTGGVFVTVTFFVAVLVPIAFVTVILTVYWPTAVKVGANVAAVVAPRNVAGCTLHAYVQPSAV